MDTLLTIGFFIAAAVVSAWLKRKQGLDAPDTWTQEDRPPIPPRRTATPGDPAAPPKPSRAVNWEEELRRMLEGDQPAAPPPPVIVREQPARPAPAPPPLVSRPVSVPPPMLRQEETSDEGFGRPVHLPTLEQSAQSYLHASQLDKRVGDRLQQIDAQVTRHQPLQQQAAPWISPEAARAMAFVRDPISIRSAIIASVILGPPKALEK